MYSEGYGNMGQDIPFGAGGDSGSMEERMLERRAERLYRTLAEKGEFAKLDKAKRNRQYRNYLLENETDDDILY